MKTIKFRVWDKVEKKMYSPFCPFVDNFIYTEEEEKNSILMQFTGLLDKNGKEIYEGDIVRVVERDFEAKIIFIDGCFRGQEETKKTRTLVEIFASECEVIGNIHENPELIDKEL